MKTLINVAGAPRNLSVVAVLEAYVRRGLPLPTLCFPSSAAREEVADALRKALPGCRFPVYAEPLDPYGAVCKWLTEGAGLRVSGGLAVRTCYAVARGLCRLALAMVSVLRWRWRKNSRIAARFDAYLSFGPMVSPVILESGMRVYSVMPAPTVFMNPERFAKDESKDHVRRRFSRIGDHERIIPAVNASAEDLLTYVPHLKSEQVLTAAPVGASLDDWADGVVSLVESTSVRTDGDEPPASHYVNNWHNNAPRTDVKRVLLVGDIAALRYRYRIVARCNAPADAFSTSLPMNDSRFGDQFKAFLDAHPYRYRSVVFMVGNLVSLEPATDAETLRALSAMTDCEAILASPLPAHLQETKYVGPVTAETVKSQRIYLSVLAARLGWRFVDICQHVLERNPTDESHRFCLGRSHVGMSDDFISATEKDPQACRDAITELLAEATDTAVDDGPRQVDVYKRMLEGGEIGGCEAKLEFEEWETLTVRNSDHSRYLFVGGCLLRDCCAASAKLKSKPTAEVYASSHSICDPGYIRGLDCMTAGKTYDAAYFNFGAHFFLHTNEEFVVAFNEILALLKRHAKKIVLLTLPEMTSTGPEDRDECAFKNTKIRWANEYLLKVCAKDYPVVPVHEMALKYVDRRKDSFHFEREVYDLLFAEIQTMVGEPTK